MKQETAEVLNLDVQKLTEMLNQALAEEWLAYYQYYQDIADFTSGIDYTTAKMAVEILEDELDHEEDILSYQHDIAALKRTIDKMIR